MIIRTNDSKRLNWSRSGHSYWGAEPVEFAAQGQAEAYGWVERTAVHSEYARQGKAGKGLLRRYGERMTGLSRAKVTRLIAAYALLARVGSAQIYRLRAAPAYRKRNVSYQPTQPTVIAIGERRRPEPNGRPGFLRMDTVHQGDGAGGTGVYHINAVDEVTQWQVMAATPRISELWLIPVLEAMLEEFPFRIHGFCSENGSEYINADVSRLLGKLLIEQTTSRSRHCNDNGLVEAKNGAVIRKHLGYGHIDAQHAAAITEFYREQLNLYVNFHCPCAVPEPRPLGNGRIQRVYRR